LEPNVADLRYFKLWILLDQIIWVWNIKGLQHRILKILRFKYLILFQRLNSFKNPRNFLYLYSVNFFSFVLQCIQRENVHKWFRRWVRSLSLINVYNICSQILWYTEKFYLSLFFLITFHTLNLSTLKMIENWLVSGQLD